MRASPFAQVITLCAIAGLVASPSALAVDKLPPIPQVPTAPRSFAVQRPADPFGKCRRYFRYKDKVLPCDSHVAIDAENLRPVLSSVPAAIEELDTYQANRRTVKSLTYVGGAGLAVAITGMLVSRRMEGMTRVTVRNLTLASGALLTLGSFTYGLILNSTNENHLDRAILLHNQAKPDTPIGIELRTEF